MAKAAEGAAGRPAGPRAQTRSCGELGGGSLVWNRPSQRGRPRGRILRAFRGLTPTQPARSHAPGRPGAGARGGRGPILDASGSGSLELRAFQRAGKGFPSGRTAPGVRARPAARTRVNLQSVVSTPARALPTPAGDAPAGPAPLCQGAAPRAPAGARPPAARLPAGLAPRGRHTLTPAQRPGVNARPTGRSFQMLLCSRSTPRVCVLHAASQPGAPPATSPAWPAPVTEDSPSHRSPCPPGPGGHGRSCPLRAAPPWGAGLLPVRAPTLQTLVGHPRPFLWESGSHVCSGAVFKSMARVPGPQGRVVTPGLCTGPASLGLCRGQRVGGGRNGDHGRSGGCCSVLSVDTCPGGGESPLYPNSLWRL